MLQSQCNGPLFPRYIFNKPVDGHALAIFGVKLDSRRIPIQSSLQRVEVTKPRPLPSFPSLNPPPLPKKPSLLSSLLSQEQISKGQGHVSLQKDTLMAAFQGPEEDFIGASIFVNVTVFSSGATLKSLAEVKTLCPSPAQTFCPCDRGPPPA